VRKWGKEEVKGRCRIWQNEAFAVRKWGKEEVKGRCRIG